MTLKYLVDGVNTSQELFNVNVNETLRAIWEVKRYIRLNSYSKENARQMLRDLEYVIALTESTLPKWV